MAKKPTSSDVAQPTDRPTKRSRRHDDRTNGTHKGRRSRASAPPAASPDVAVVPKARLSNKIYLQELADLQIELVKLQEWIRHAGLKIVVIFEGRDAAGKGGAIKRVTESLSPRIARHRPNASERSGISSATSLICPRPARSSCSTVPGTTAPVWSGSWASARNANTEISCGRLRSSSGCWSAQGSS